MLRLPNVSILYTAGSAKISVTGPNPQRGFVTEDPASMQQWRVEVEGLSQILETYAQLYEETGKEQPLLKQASFINAKEAMAAGEHGCHSATISPQVLGELASLTYDESKRPAGGKPKSQHACANWSLPERLRDVSKSDPLSVGGNPSSARTETDYLANNGEELHKAIVGDPVTKQRLEDALALFTGGLMESRPFGQFRDLRHSCVKKLHCVASLGLQVVHRALQQEQNFADADPIVPFLR
ncbi:hypothetical protein BST61_g10010 [Cercospora zeina]